jgi:acetolactate synthase I/II/III large subunit
VEYSRKVVADWRAEFAPFLHAESSPIRPERICRELTDHLPSNAFVLSDTGHSGLWTGGYLDLNNPDQGYVRCAGHLGWGFPAALGAKCALPDRPVVLFSGDAGFWYHIGELETGVRWNINAIIVVNNNCSQNQEIRVYSRAYGGQQRANSRQLWTFKQTNLSRVAEAMGAFAIRVERPGDLKGALEEALSIKNGPVVVEVVSDIEALAPVAYAGE